MDKMTGAKILRTLGLALCLVLTIGSEQTIDGQLIGADGLLGVVDQLLAAINMAQPSSGFREQSEHREQALNDHSNDEIYGSTAQQIIERSGFQQKTYKVTTKDGYITELINVINPLADRSQLKQPPVMLFHGGLIEPTTFVWASAIQHHPEKYPRTAEDGPITSSNRSLGLMLPNYGYDVWLPATRGCNKQNLGHTSLKARLLEDILAEGVTDLELASAPRELLDTLRYFEFSQDELVEIEFPAQIDRVLELTNSSKVSTLSYSMSAHVMFKLLASRSAAADKVHTHVSLAPLLNNKGANTFWLALEHLSAALPDPIGNLLVTQVVASSLTRDLVSKLDRYTLVYYLLTVLLGSSPRYQTFIELPILGHLLKPLSFTQLKHYCQQVLAGRLQKYDHGPAKNRQLYNGSSTPPVYEIGQIRLKRWMMVAGDTDVLGTLDSAQQFERLIPNKPDKFIVHRNGWNHLDHSGAFENDVKVNLPVLEFYDKFSSLDAAAIDSAD